MPLNGTKIHPLSDFAIGIMRRLKNVGPMPVQEINPGVWARLKDEDLVESFPAKSPYKKHSAFVKINFARLSEAGEKRLAELS